MKVEYKIASFRYMLEHIMYFQEDKSSGYWSDALYYYFPKLDKEKAFDLELEDRKKYIGNILLDYYNNEYDNMVKLTDKSKNVFDNISEKFINALTQIFDIDCVNNFNNIECNICLNPVNPRFLKEKKFDAFYKSTPNEVLGISCHEIIHFVWFTKWNEIFKDNYDEYESPSLKWLLSEMVIDCVMNDNRLQFLQENINNKDKIYAYDYFYVMDIDGINILATLNEMYKNQNIEDFMKNSFEYCLKHQNEIYKKMEYYENHSEVLDRELETRKHKLNEEKLILKI